nr:amino acid adenylation domain-containing protein [Pyrinomonadaceae bacterium]
MMKTPPDCFTLADVLRFRASQQPGRCAYAFLNDGEKEEARLTYRQLDRQARAVAASLQALGAAGEHAVLLYPPGLDYIVALFGCWYAGVVAIPAYPPLRDRANSRFQSIMVDAQPKLALSTRKVLSEPRLGAAREASTCHWLATDTIPVSQAGAWRDPRVSSNALALLQYTSGSTTSPKGVMVDHANLLSNERMIQLAMVHTEDSTFVSWLPIYHDMGLIGNLLQPLYIGASCYLMSPVAFLQEPFRWLKAISAYEAHTSGGPDFAYDLCVQRITPEQQLTLDLSCWQVAYNGSEPVRADTLERFVEKFKGCGFRREAFYPCYGLAETTLLVSGGMKQEPPVIQFFDAASLKQNLVVESTEGNEGAQALVGCGHTVLDQQITVVHPDLQTQCPDGQVGEIWVRGPNVAQGYWNRPDVTASTFHARLRDTGEGPFLRTGDLGFLRNAELFVTGRLKDLIIIRGQNHYPQDIEQTVERSHAALRVDGSAAFSVDALGEEQLVVVAEVNRQHLRRFDRDSVVFAIREAVAETHELRVHAVVLIKPGRLPKTSSGKRQRHLCKAQFLDGYTDAVAEWRETISSDLQLSGLVLVSPPPNADAIEAWLVSQLAARLSVRSDQIDVQERMTRYGVDSLVAVELCHRIESSLGVAVPISDLLGDFSISEIAVHVYSQFTAPSIASSTRSTLAKEAAREAALSHGQKALWFLQQATPTSPAYNIARALHIQSKLDVSVLREVFQKLVDRHASLRTNFINGEDGPIQQIQTHTTVCFKEEDATSWNQARLKERLADRSHRPFDLEHDALLRVILFRCAPQEYVLLISVHHIVADFWSLALLVHELGMSYASITHGTEPPLPAVIQDYSGFVHWQSELLASPEGERLRGFWQQHLAGKISALNLPTDRARPQVQTQGGSKLAFSLGSKLTRKIKELSRNHGVTLYMVHLAALQALLYRYTGQQDLVIGSITNGRSLAEMAGVVGYLVNTIALRASISGAETFSDLLQQTRHSVLEALRHQDYPFALLVEQLQPARDPSRSRLLQVMFVFQKAHLDDEALTQIALGEAGARMDWGGVRVESLEMEQRWAQFDLTLTLADVRGEIRGSAEYSTDVFDRATIERMLEHFRTLLASVVVDPSRRIDDLPLLTDAERRQLLLAQNSRAKRPLREPLIHQRFEVAAHRFPAAVALTFENEQLTYGELNRRANQLAHYLRRLGVAPEVPVGICAQPSLELVVGLLGILKAGGMYVPLDPSNPPERLRMILEDVGAPVLLTQNGLPGRLSLQTARVICLGDKEIEKESAENPASKNLPENAAYVIYTSGSTGMPKGSIVSHRNVVRLFEQTQPWFGFGENDVWTLFHSHAFDFSVWELWGALFYGGRLVVIPPSTRRSPEMFYKVLASEQVTVLNQTPSAFYQLMSTEENSGSSSELALRLIIFGGEALSLPRLGPWFERHEETKPQLVNMYGITETTVHVTYRPVTKADVIGGSGSAVGRPIPDLQVYILDKNLQPVPIGVAGELYIAGAGLARGYLNRPDLTAERFIPHPFPDNAGERLYRSGDLARYRANGDIEYLGRVDDQIKIRGFRVEPGEIQAILCQHGEVRD